MFWSTFDGWLWNLEVMAKLKLILFPMKLIVYSRLYILIPVTLLFIVVYLFCFQLVLLFIVDSRYHN